MTIKERAIESTNKMMCSVEKSDANSEIDEPMKDFLKSVYYSAFTVGAMSQLKVDTQKSFDWFMDKLNSDAPVDYESWEKEHRQIMEE